MSGAEYIGHGDAWAQWHRALAGSRMHHGWILSGRRGVGKSAFARAAAREWVAQDGIAQPAGEHPDILYITHPPKDDKEAKKRADGRAFEIARNIRIDQIRQLQHRLHTRPSLGDRRAVIIDPADDMEKSTANALLKSLEEPPTGTIFLLVTHRIGRLLPTIRSRCRVLSFPEVNASDMQAVLAREAPQVSSEERDAAIAAASGSPGAAIDFVELGLGRIHNLMRRIAQEGDPSFALRGELAAALGARPDRKRQLATLELARAVIADRLKHVERRHIPALVETHAEIVRLAAQAPTANFDAGMLIMQIGTLLTHIAVPRELANG